MGRRPPAGGQDEDAAGAEHELDPADDGAVDAGRPPGAHHDVQRGRGRGRGGGGGGLGPHVGGGWQAPSAVKCCPPPLPIKHL